MDHRYNGTYAGYVEKNDDPDHLGRLKVRVPHVYGVSGNVTGFVPVDSLPWALPVGLPAGGTNESGGMSWLPREGDQVFVRFLDGEPEKPIWEWGNQTKDQAAKLKLHHYNKSPDRSILTRYGHTFELTPTGLTLSTKQGYQVLLDESTAESGGSVSMQTPTGQRLTFNDLRKTGVFQAFETAVVSASKVILNAASRVLLRASRSLSMMVGGTLVTIQDKSIVVCTGTGASLIVDGDGNVTAISADGASISAQGKQVQVASPNGTGVVVENDKISFNAPQAVFDSASFAVGKDAKWPVLMLTPTMMTYLTTHKHTLGYEGAPTGPPLPLDPPDPLFPTNAGSTRVRTT
jgi:hypothetical protein